MNIDNLKDLLSENVNIVILVIGLVIAYLRYTGLANQLQSSKVFFGLLTSGLAFMIKIGIKRPLSLPALPKILSPIIS